jgi:hypothetical protein
MIACPEIFSMQRECQWQLLQLNISIQILFYTTRCYTTTYFFRLDYGTLHGYHQLYNHLLDVGSVFGLDFDHGRMNVFLNATWLLLV